MTDVTAWELWRRLVDVLPDVVGSGENWLHESYYDQFTWRRVDVLDMLFLGWIALAFLVILLVNVYIRFFGFPKCLRRATAGGEGACAPSGNFWSIKYLKRSGESAAWVNDVLRWVLANYSRRSRVIEAWMTTAIAEANKYTSEDIQLRYDNVELGSTPLQFTNVTTDASSKQDKAKDDLIIYATMSSSNVRLGLTVITKTSTNLQTESCDVLIVQLHAPVTISIHFSSDSLYIQLSIMSSPDLKLRVTPSNYNSKFDKNFVERAIISAINNLHVSVDLVGTGLSVQPINSQQEKNSLVNTNCNHYRPLVTVQKLIVKIIKANGLVDKDFSNCDPYARVSVDEPQQNFITSVVKNTANPFFDEHFVFDLNSNTSRLQLLIYGKRPAPSVSGTTKSATPARAALTGDVSSDVDEFLGQAKMAIDDIRRLTKSRQIVPLTGLPKGSSSATGSLTVEFLFIDVPAESIVDSATYVSHSPAVRRTETNHTLTPVATLVGTETKSTENFRLHDFKSTVNAKTRDLSSSQQQMATSGSTTVVNNTGQRASRPTLPQLKTTQPSDDESYQTSFKRATEQKVEAKSNSIVSHLRRSFGRPKTTRARSTDKERTGADSLLKPPDRTLADHSDGCSVDGSLRPSSRSHSLSSSFRNLFRRKKRHGEKSRENSKSPMGRDVVSSATLTPQPSPRGPTKGSLPTPYISVATDNSVRHSYSSSMPPLPSPLTEEH